MLELSKKVLEKVSFDRSLFHKELRKAIRWVSKEDVVLLQVWCLTAYGHLYGDVISDCFSTLV
jgi:hypothetical protein